jgi:hypothetical protein
VQTPAVGAEPRPAAKPRQPAAAATRQKCFIFNNNQYCE